MNYLGLNADTIAAYGTVVFLILDVITLILIGVFTQRIRVASSRNDTRTGEGYAPGFPLVKLHMKNRSLAVPASRGIDR